MSLYENVSNAQGIGYEIESITPARLAEYFVNHKNTLVTLGYNVDASFPDVISHITKTKEFCDAEEITHDTWDATIGELIRDILCSENDLIGFQSFEACEDTGVKENVIYTPLYPWEMNYTERHVKAKDIFEILENTKTELGIADAVEYQDYQYI